MTDLVLGVTKRIHIENDRPLVERLIDAVLRANESAYNDDSQWATIRRMQNSVVEAIRARDTAAVSPASAARRLPASRRVHTQACAPQRLSDITRSAQYAQSFS